MRVMTITCHNVYNAGATLQAWALSTYVASLGHEVQIIDYRPDYLTGAYCVWGHVSERFNKPGIRIAYEIMKLPSRIRARNSLKKKRFDEFTNQHMSLTSTRYGSLEELMGDPPLADVYFAGSDQIWNTLRMNGRDPSFYLEFAPNNSIKASYAASFASENILPNMLDQVKSWIEALDFISVRESSALTILDQMGISTGRLVLDPVFLIEETAWAAMAAPRLYDEPYVFVYAFEGGKSIEEYAVRMAKERGLKIVTLQELGYGDVSFPDSGPLEFLSLVRHADLVLSNSFHATVFSVIFEKQFRVFNRGESINARLVDFANLIGVPQAYMASREPDEDGFQIEYTAIKPMISELIRSSKYYIDEVLEVALTRKGDRY